MTHYNLPDVLSPVGTFKIRLSSIVAGLTVPTKQTIKSIGPWKAAANFDLGIQELETCAVTILDDTSTYDAGFWYKLVRESQVPLPQIRIYLDEGVGDTFFFYGTLLPEMVRWEESYIGTEKVREGVIEFTSIASVMFDTDVETWITEVLANDVSTGESSADEVDNVIKVLGLFAAMLSASQLNGSYDIADVSFVYGTQDLKWADNVATEYRLDQLYVGTTYNNGDVPDITIDYWDLAGASHLGTFYSTLQPLVSDMLKNFGVIMVMDYDLATLRHKIKLVQRARAYSATLDFGGREKQSQITQTTELQGDAVMCRKLKDQTLFVWRSQKYSGNAGLITDPLDGTAFNVEFSILFGIYGSGGIPPGEILYGKTVDVNGSNGNPEFINGVVFYNYLTNSYDGNTIATKTQEEASSGYLQGRYANSLFHKFTRTYRTMQADAGGGDTHSVVEILKTQEINDGIYTRTYQANKAKKMPDSDEVEVEWIIDYNP